MRAIEKFLWSVVPLLIVVLLAYFTVRSRPQQAASAPVMPAVPVTSAAAEIRMYLRIEGVEGEGTDDSHKGCLEVQTYEQGHIWGDPHVTEGGTTDDLRTIRLTVTRPVDKVTPLLYERCCKQTPIRTVTLELWREGGAASQKLMVYTHHECALNAIRNMKGLTADGPTEELTFTSAGAEWTYLEYDASGKVKGETHTQWDGLLGK